MVKLDQEIEIISKEKFKEIAQYCNDNGFILNKLDEKKYIIKSSINEDDVTKSEKQQRKVEIQIRLNQLSQDFVQAMAGAYFEDLEARKAEFQTLHNELRVLEGKEPREYNTQNSLTNT